MKKGLVTIFTLLIINFLSAQNVGINTTTPDASAALDITSTTSGILVPRMTTTQRTAITTPATGLLVYDTTLGQFYFYSSTGWTAIPLSTTTAISYIGTSYLGKTSGYGSTGTTEGSGLFSSNLNNISIGNNAGNAMTNGGENIFLGSSAGYTNSNGAANIAIGKQALLSNTYLNNTIAIGQEAAKNIIPSNSYSDAQNAGTIAIGYQALGSSYSVGNVAIGYQSVSAHGFYLGTTAVGYQALAANVSNYNTAFGFKAGYTNVNGDNNTLLGYSADVATNNLDNATAIGANAIVGASNSLVLGGTGAYAVKVGIGTTTPSEVLDIVGKTKTTTFQLTNGATNGYVLQSDASGNGTWVNPTAFSITESDPQVASSTSNYVPKWNGTALADGTIYDNGNIGIGTSSPTNKLDIQSSSSVTANVQSNGSNAYVSTAAPSASEAAFAFKTYASGSLLTRWLFGKSNASESGSDAGSDFFINRYNDAGAYLGQPLSITRSTGQVNIGTLKATTFQMTTSPTNGYVLQSDASGNGTWVNPTTLSNGNWTTSSTNQYSALSGNVGIGTTAPTSKLDILTTSNLVGRFKSSSSYGTMVSLENSSTAGRTWDFISTGADNIEGAGKLLVKGNSGVVMAFSGTNVGIGSYYPLQAKLVVDGSDDYTFSSYGFINSSGNTGTGSGNNNYSIYASDRIAGTEFNAFSDRRIKRILRGSNSNEDLTTLMKIKITDYKLIDSIAKGNKEYKKVIAQELAEVYPNAVSKMTDVIPNIYKLTSIKDGFVNLENHDLKVGDKVKLIFGDKQELCKVLKTNKNGFYTEGVSDGAVFVYGKEVNDFHTVDYEALSTLNISATQELVKQLNDLKAQNAKLQSDNDKIKADNSSMKADIEALKAAVFKNAN
jgi:Chaperone of endosialidase